MARLQHLRRTLRRTGDQGLPTGPTLTIGPAAHEIPVVLLDWAAGVVGEEACITGAQRLRTNHGPWRLRVRRSGRLVDAVLKAGSTAEWSEPFACEAAALEVARQHGIPAPMLLGLEPNVAGTGRAALLMTHLKGTTRIPARTTNERLRSIGAMAATIHRVRMQPSALLPRRRRHTAWTNFSLWRRWARRYASAPEGRRRAVAEAFLDENPAGGTDPMTGATDWSIADAEETLSGTGSTSLLDEADERLAAATPTDDATVFVHGDLWHGNTLWDGDRCTAVLDWELAGAGNAGVDLGCLRWDAVMLYGAWAADDVLAGWEEAADRRATSVAYWDLAAVLNYPTNIERLTNVMSEFGRSDLDAATLHERRDAFAEGALSEL